MLPRTTDCNSFRAERPPYQNPRRTCVRKLNFVGVLGVFTTGYSFMKLLIYPRGGSRSLPSFGRQRLTCTDCNGRTAVGAAYNAHGIPPQDGSLQGILQERVVLKHSFNWMHLFSIRKPRLFLSPSLSVSETQLNQAEMIRYFSSTPEFIRSDPRSEDKSSCRCTWGV